MITSISESPGALRFVERPVQVDPNLVRVERILQQQWAVTTYDDDAKPNDVRMEWRDVPLVLNDKP